MRLEMMFMTYRGHIEGGAIVLDEAPDLPEGARVRCVLMLESADEPTKDPKRPRGSGTPRHAGLLKFARIVKDSPSDAARNLGHYLYGHAKK